MSAPAVANAAVDMVDRNVARGRGGKAAFIDPARRLTYGELADGAARRARCWRSSACKREDRVAMIMLDTVDFPDAVLGRASAPALFQCRSTRCSPPRSIATSSRTRARQVLFVSRAPARVAQRGGGRIDPPRRIVVVGECGRPAALRHAAWPPRRRRAGGADVTPTRLRSGSIRRAPPACRRACATSHSSAMETAQALCAGRARHPRGRRRLLGREAVLRLRARQRA